MMPTRQEILSSQTKGVGEALRSAYTPVSTQGPKGKLQVIEGTITKGFGIASGRTPNKYGGSTLGIQRDIIKDVNPDLHAILQTLFLGTLNIQTNLWLLPIRFDWEIERLMWTPHIPKGENFGYINTVLEHFPSVGPSKEYEGFTYYPKPETKGSAAGESHDFTVLEEWMPEIPNQARGDRVRIIVPEDTFILLPSPKLTP